MAVSVNSTSHKMVTPGDRRDSLAAARQLLAAALQTTAEPKQRKMRAAVNEGKRLADRICALGMPDDVVAATLLYPPLRDKFLEEKSLKTRQLSGLLKILSSLVQLGHFALPADWRPGEALATSQSEALRKMLLAVVADVRLVIVRIAEQVDRLQQAKSAPLATRRALAIEAQEIYAPLANRLGVWQLKWELEDLAFRFLEPDAYASIARGLKETRTEREQFIEHVRTTLQTELAEEGIEATVTGRPKHIYSIWRKMRRKDGGMETLFDIRAVRILVNDVRDCYAALGTVHKSMPHLRGEFDDYIANPKDNDYRSLHTAVMGPDGKTLEVQIRTYDMHQQAELGVAAHWRYKEGGSAPASFDRKIRLLRQLLEPGGDDDLLERLGGDLFNDRVYALSPKGDVVEMPTGATPLDFAYHVHTSVGHRCRGAKINGRIAPLTSTIKNGDRIEIITGSEPQPSRDWLSPRLGYLASARSRAKVRNWFRLQDRDQHVREGREILERELHRLGVTDVATEHIARQLKQKDAETLYAVLGAGDLSAASIATALQQLRGTPLVNAVSKRRAATKRQHSSEAVSVYGLGDLMSNFARCCRPVPPELIAGYITQGRGVSVHRADCGNLLGLNRRYPERAIVVAWGNPGNAVYPVELSVEAHDRNGLLRDISAVIADGHANVVDLQSHTDKESMLVAMRISIEVRDLAALSTIIARLEPLRSVARVRRLR